MFAEKVFLMNPIRFVIIRGVKFIQLSDRAQLKPPTLKYQFKNNKKNGAKKASLRFKWLIKIRLYSFFNACKFIIFHLRILGEY